MLVGGWFCVCECHGGFITVGILCAFSSVARGHTNGCQICHLDSRSHCAHTYTHARTHTRSQKVPDIHSTSSDITHVQTHSRPTWNKTLDHVFVDWCYAYKLIAYELQFICVIQNYDLLSCLMLWTFYITVVLHSEVCILETLTHTLLLLPLIWYGGSLEEQMSLPLTQSSGFGWHLSVQSQTCSKKIAPRNCTKRQNKSVHHRLNQTYKWQVCKEPSVRCDLVQLLWPFCSRCSCNGIYQNYLEGPPVTAPCCVTVNLPPQHCRETFSLA